MKNLVIRYRKQNYNCCESIIMAADTKYRLNISKDMLRFTSCMANGMGIGSTCSAIIAGVMVIGYIFEKKYAPEHSDIKHIRMEFLDKVSEKFKTTNCYRIRNSSINNCGDVLETVADTLEEVIDYFLLNK